MRAAFSVLRDALRAAFSVLRDAYCAMHDACCV
jgi:hypothetical protein